MSNDIKVGDLVWVARPATCCGDEESIGEVFSVVNLEVCPSECIKCGSLLTEAVADTGESGFDKDGFYLHCRSVDRLEKFRDFPESELREVSKELEVQS